METSRDRPYTTCLCLTPSPPQSALRKRHQSRDRRATAFAEHEPSAILKSAPQEGHALDHLHPDPLSATHLKAAADTSAPLA